MMKMYFLIAICTITMLVSCGDDDVNGNNNDGLDRTKIYHTAVGAEWLYDEIRFYEGVVTDTNEQKEVIVGKEIKNGETVYRLSVDDGDEIRYATNRADGLYIQRDSNSNFEFYRKFPCTAGEKFIDAKSDNVEVISTSKQITVRGKTYTTVLYRNIYSANGILSFEDEYFEPGIGLVKVDRYEIDSYDVRKQVKIQELKSFKKGM